MAFDHVLGADRVSRPGWRYPYDAESRFHEPLVLFGFLAAHSAMELVTGVLILPQRQTALVAKQAAQVDLLTGGRFRLGVGVGWNALEYEALGVPFDRRGARLEEQIAVLRRLWTEDSVDLETPHHRVDPGGAGPVPVQRPMPVWMGVGVGTRVLEGVGRLADGWIIGEWLGVEIDEPLAVVRRTSEAHGRSVGVQGVVELRLGRDEVRR